MSQRVSTKVESGTCNVCSAPCSSCMHLNKASMGSKRKEYSDESCSRDVGSQFSVNDGDVSPPFSSRASENQHLIADGKGNEVRFGGTREILSGNIENSSSDCDMMHPKVVARPKNTGDDLFQKSHLKSDQMSSFNEHLERVEGEDDNISCLSSLLDNTTNNSDNMDQKSLRMALLQSEGNEIIDNIPDTVVKSFDEESVEKNKSGGLPDSPSEAPQGDESEEADIVEDDVKVCDICGDAGREDSLAICSRCSDGAEHIYCMREMLRKLPEGDWLCEECKMADETGKLDEGPVIGGRKSSKVPTSSQVSHRGISEKVEVFSNLTVQVHETISSKSAKPGVLAVLSRDSSIKDTNRGRGKLLHQTSNATHSTHDSSENVRTSTTSQVHSSKGALLKSNSFSGLNSKPKVKLIDEVAAQKQKGRLHPLANAKDGPLRALSKSVSFKSANPGRLVGDSKVKMLPTKFSHAQELKGIRHVKDGSTSDSMNSRKLERSLTSLARSSSSLMTPKGDQKPSSGCESFPLVPGNNSRDLKVGLSDGKPSFSKTAFYKNPDLPVSSDHKANHSAVKDESVSISSRTVDRLNNGGHGARHDGLSRSRGFANLTEKIRETPGASPRQIGLNCSRSVFCSICKDIGHDSDSCPTSNSQVGASNASTARSSREDGHGFNKLKTPITSAMLKKPGIYRRSKAPEKLDDSSLSSHDSAPLTTQDLSVPSDMSRKLTSANGAPEKEAVQGCNSDSCKQSVVNDKMQLAGLQAEIMHSFRKRNSDGQSDGKPYPIDLPRVTSVLMSAVCRTSIIPELDYVWQGDFKVCKGTKQLDICGFQAHLSTSASLKVREAVKKFPGGIMLSEVPRLCTWPAQFDCGVHDENIALFFFAKDTESYEKSYKGLVDNMIKCDLALKASWDGVELLIFPSNKLPEKSQRWNMFYYLWGVFRGQRAVDSDSESGSLQKVNSSNLKEIPLHTGIPAATVSSVDEAALPKYDGQNSSSCVRSCNLNLPSKDSAAEALGGSHSYEDMSKDFHSEGPTTDKMHSAFQVAMIQGSSNSKMEMDLEPNAVLVGPNCSTSGGERIAIRGDIFADKRDYQCPLKDMEIDDKDKMRGGRDDIDFDEKARKGDNEAAFRRDHASSEEVGSPNCKRKRHHPETSKGGLETSAGTSQTELWNNVNDASIDKELNKKHKAGNIGMSEGSNCKNSISLGDFASTNHQQGPKAVTVNVFGKECDEQVVEGAETAERYFFPVVSSSVEDLDCSDGSIAWKQRPSKVSSRSHDGVPNLELALGAEKKRTEKGILPVLVGMLDKNDGQTEPSAKGVVKGDEDDASGSLSLSLSFPFPKNEQSIRHISDAEQPLQENHANASFLLFRSYLKK